MHPGIMTLSSAAVMRSFKSRSLLKLSQLSAYSTDFQGEAYRQAFRQSVQDPETYWTEAANNIVWDKPFRRILDNSNEPFTKWFADGKLSLCYNALDHHVDKGRGDQTAILWDSPATGNKRELSFSHLQDEVSKLAGLLSRLGVEKGDRVLIYMPMIPETVQAMLATIRLGAVHSLVFGGFSAKELATRIRHCQPKVILSASCGLEPSRIVNYKWIVDEAMTLANGPDIPRVVFQRPNLPKANLTSTNDMDWADEIKDNIKYDCVSVDANHPLYILYTSGTTGDPKGLVHPTGGHAVVNKWTMRYIYGMSENDIWWTASDLGWIVGHEYICYSPLLNGNTTILYEGKPVGMPNAQHFQAAAATDYLPKNGNVNVKPAKNEDKLNHEVKRVINEHQVNGFFTAPTALRGLMKEAGVTEKIQSKSLKRVFLAGELLDEGTKLWAKSFFGVPIVNHWWQTETAHAITSACVGLGNSAEQPSGSVGFPVPGFDVKILRDDGSQAEPGESGRIVCRLPLAPGTFITLYNADDRYQKTYFSKYPGYYDTMDAGMIDENGYVFITGREDDVINVAGHRLSTKSLEEAILHHPDVEDCAVVGIPDDLKGLMPLAMYVKRPGSTKSNDEISKNLIGVVREQVGPVAAFRLSVAVKALPRTRSGKTARKSLAQMASGEVVKVPPTIEDATVYIGIQESLESLGLPYPIQQPDLP